MSKKGAKLKIDGDMISVQLKKKTHLPILFDAPWMNRITKLSWLGAKISYAQGTVSWGYYYYLNENP